MGGSYFPKQNPGGATSSNGTFIKGSEMGGSYFTNTEGATSTVHKAKEKSTFSLHT